MISAIEKKKQIYVPHICFPLFCQTNINQIIVSAVRMKRVVSFYFRWQFHPSMIFWTIFKYQSYLPRWSI